MKAAARCLSPCSELLRLVHVEQLDLSQVKRVDFEIISYLKESHPDLYRSLRRAVKQPPSRTARYRGVDLAPRRRQRRGYDDDISTLPPRRASRPEPRRSRIDNGRPAGGRLHFAMQHRGGAEPAAALN